MDKLICYIHIEKAAGSTLHQVFLNNYPNYLTLSPFYYWSNEPNNHLNARELKWLLKLTPNTPAIGGHTLRNYLDYERHINRPVQYVTFLREPISRYLSHYKYQKYIKAINWSMDSFIDEPRFNNYMTNRISKNGNLNEAIHHLENTFSFVGCIEKFEQSLVLMREVLSIPELIINFENENVNKNTNDLPITELQWEKITNNNDLDIQLYKYFYDNIFHSYLSLYSNILEEQIQSLKLSNQKFKFNASRKMLGKIYRKFYYKNVELSLKWALH